MDVNLDSFAIRDLDGLEFYVKVLQIDGEVCSILYLDDGNVEKDVPLEELLPVEDETKIPTNSECLRETTSSTDNDEDGGDDGERKGGELKVGEEWEEMKPTVTYHTNDPFEMKEDTPIILDEDSMAYGSGIKGIRQLRKKKEKR